MRAFGCEAIGGCDTGDTEPLYEEAALVVSMQ